MQKCVELVDLDKCWILCVFLQRSASMQPRTSLLKFLSYRSQHWSARGHEVSRCEGKAVLEYGDEASEIDCHDANGGVDRRRVYL